ncbi:MAG: hypothetical protein OJJ54_03365 [Pseudonocardia sp.]|nr:hypothetical protein [Pseudonocardia sp.]
MSVLDDTRPAGPPPTPASPRFSGGRVLQVAAAVAAAAAVVFGALWLTARTDGALSLGSERDAVLLDARQAAINLNTLDFHNPDPGLDLWEQSSTGPVLEEFRTNRPQYAEFVVSSKRTTRATVSDAAVSELDDRAGVARVLVGVDVTVTPDGQEPIQTRQRLQLEMTRTEAGWKVSKLAPIRSPGAGG